MPEAFNRPLEAIARNPKLRFMDQGREVMRFPPLPLSITPAKPPCSPLDTPAQPLKSLSKISLFLVCLVCFVGKLFPVLLRPSCWTLQTLNLEL